MKTYRIKFPSSVIVSHIDIKARSKTEAIARLNQIIPHYVVLITSIIEI